MAMSLSTRFALQFGLTAALTVSLVLATALGLFSLRLDTMAHGLSDKLEKAVAAQIRRDSEAMLEALVDDIREPLLAYDRVALDRHAAEALRRSTAVALSIYDNYGRTVADGAGQDAAFERTAPRALKGIGAADGVVRWYEGNRLVSGRAVCIRETCIGAVTVTVDAAVVARERQAAERQIEGARRDFFTEAGVLGAAGLALGTVLAALVGWLLGRRLMRSLKAAVSGLEQLAAGSVGVKVEAKEAELKELAAAVEKVAERMATMGPEQEAILADMADGLFVAGTDGHLFVANPALHELLAAAPGSLVGQDAFAVFGIGPQPGAEAACAALTALDALSRSDGTRVPVMISAKLSAGKDGQAPRIIGVLRDMAERAAVERQLVEAQLRAEAADKAKAEFLAVMSHELRTPLNGVLGGAAVLAGSELTANQRSLVGIVQNSGRALLTMVTNILDFSRAESSEDEPTQAPVDLETLAREIAAHIEADARAKGLTLDVRVQPDAPTVLSDEEKLLEIGNKLAENAVKFTTSGGIGIDISYDRKGDAVDFTLTIDDSGIGIDPAKREAIFDLFTQADSSERRSHTGAGLGLAITKRLTEVMGGEITVESEPDVGTTFRVKLKAAVDPDAAVPPKPAELAGARTMVVSPSQRERDALAEQLTAAGAEAEEFETARDALAALREALAAGEPFGLVVHPDDLADFEPSGLAEWLRSSSETESVASVVVRPEQERMAALAQLPERIQTAAAPVTGSVLLDAAANAIRAATKPTDDWVPEPVAIPITIADGGASPRSAASGAPDTAGDGPPLQVVTSEPEIPIVLLAESNEVNRIVLGAYLKKAGYQVETVENGFEAVKHFKETRPTLVLMDVDMPVMNGLEATKAIRRHEIEESMVPTPIIGLAAPRREGERERTAAAGMNDHLPKPIKIEELEAKLERWTKLASRPLPSQSIAS